MFRVASTVTENNEAKLSLQRVDNPSDDELKPDEILVRIEACPVNPSDLGVIVPAGTDEKALSSIKPLAEPEIGWTYQIDKKFSKIHAPRVGRMIPAGNEGAGVVIRAGSGDVAQSMVGKVVSFATGGMYTQFKKVNVMQVLVHKDGTSCEEAASSYVNPVTVVGMIETLRTEKHKAMIHTAAASNLGQMLQKMCIKENIPLINVVRKDSQEKILRDLGAEYVIRSDKETFMTDLAKAVAETEATLAFDAIGGGTMVSNLLTAMEMGAKKFAKEQNVGTPYGTDVYKQVYIYGGLDRSQTVLSRGFGFSWGISAWLMPRFLQKLPMERIPEIQKMVTDNIKTIFKSQYYKRVSLAELLDIENFLECAKQETGKKFLVLPNKEVDQLKTRL